MSGRVVVILAVIGPLRIGARVWRGRRPGAGAATDGPSARERACDTTLAASSGFLRVGSVRR